MTEATIQHDVFISYRFEQRVRYFVDVMESQFEAAQPPITYWRDRRNITAGMGWEEAIDDAINACRIVVVIITPEATQSQYVNYEWCYALGRGKHIIPVYFDDSDVHVKLRKIQALDFTSRRSEKPPWDDLITQIQAKKQLPVGKGESLGTRIEAEIQHLVNTVPSGQPIQIDQLIDLLMRERQIDHAQVHRIQDMLLRHRSAKS
ncbi:MAG: toll/interleukin-1 receptor domain-containing protein [bacterium]|nr:toll/interleukin-1 receptor domain-containing protein [bacterium]